MTAPTQTHVPPRFAERLLQLVGAPVNPQNLRFLHAWVQAEGGNAKWNAINSTYPLPFGESWPLTGNTSGVQNYWRATGGVAATALTLIQGTYAGILGDLQSGIFTAEQIVERRRDQIRIWGTNPDTILTVLKTGF